jgi:predicted secreted protein
VDLPSAVAGLAPIPGTPFWAEAKVASRIDMDTNDSMKAAAKRQNRLSLDLRGNMGTS